MTRGSLAARTIVLLCVAQLVAFAIAWLVSLGIGLGGAGSPNGFLASTAELAATRARNQVLASLTVNRDGEVRIEPTSDLREEMRRTPGMRFAAVHTNSRSPVPGSSPELAAMIQPLIALDPTHVHFLGPGDQRGLRTGMLEPQWTRFGRMHIAISGTAFQWSDLWDEGLESLRWTYPYLVTAMVMSVVAAWLAVRWGLAPLRAVAAEAAGIDMDSLHQRLSLDGVSAEIEPLVAAVNGALERLDAGVARQRRFTANAAHELRTPVTILGARLDAPEEPSFKTDLRRDHRRIRNIVEQLLATARLGERQARLAEPVDLCALARAMIADAALLAVRSRRRIALDAPDAPVLVRGNRGALESVVANLVDNALRAEPEGGAVLVRVGADKTLAVVDHGCGVASGDREALFEPFWRKSEATPGTGLGLAIAKEVMDSHDGRIAVTDTPGGGATFTIAFPGPPASSKSRQRERA
ncbi:cell wall metabolism sensor histidine kinase WalK [Methylosinus sp. Sm6]|uniref:sensor histidine kinase n=1 Tax=Methylosinus sp. Sm6 TaxID=2866948 RepID=UPI001C9904F2|nr:HAMP domain-containing sensor histidine kinase [Methylosinus sp. Sm6]MBY6241993.1 HAMP domain-containing histidine kinase [Methylosinus sp. Sm6]